MKFRIFILLPFFILGIVTFNFFKDISFIFIAVCFVIITLISIVRRNIIWVLLYVFFISGGFSYLIINKSINEKYNALLEYREFNGKIVDIKNDSLTIKNKDYKIVFFIPKNIKGKYNFNLGDYVDLKGKIKEKVSYRENNMASRGINAYGDIRSIVNLDKSVKLSNIPLKIKDRINSGLISVDKESGPFVSGLVTGYTSNINEEDLSIFTELEIIHIIAVSGFNVAIIYSVIMIIMRKFIMIKRLIISFCSCFLYVSITGFDPSITRAFIMISMVILGRLISKGYSTVNALSVAGFLMLSVNPFYIYNLGFIFSYLATLSIAMFNSEIVTKIEGYSKLFKDEISTTISSTVFTFPIAIYNRGYFSIISLAVNVILGPIVSLITIVGFISSFLYVIIPFNMIFYPVVFIGDITLIIIRIFGKINPLVYTGPPTIIFIVCYYIGVLLIMNVIKLNKEFYRYSALAVLLSIVLLQGALNSNNLKIHFINVGQGDSIFIEAPGKKSILIDTGNKIEDYIAAKSKVVPYIKRLGYNNIDYLIISHFHDDHAGGVDYIKSVMPIHNKVTYEGSDNKDYYGLLKGDSLSVAGVEFDVISPKDTLKVEDENKKSLVLELNYKGFSALFTGDATKDEMDEVSGEYDVLKVPHHGSKYSVSEKMFSSSKVDTAVFTVGNNNFGHPSKEALDSFEKRDIDVYRTDKHGNIVYIVNSKGYKVKFNN